MNSALLAGSRRIVGHNTFVELHWIRDPRDFTFKLGIGFQRAMDLLDDDLVTILEDLYSLQCKRDSSSFSCDDTVDLIHVDNQQASIQSRIYNRLVDASMSPLLRCLYMAAYLGATVLCCCVLVAAVSTSPHFLASKGLWSANLRRRLGRVPGCRLLAPTPPHAHHTGPLVSW